VHQGLVGRPAAASLYNGLVQVIKRQLQRLPRIVQLLIQIQEKGQAMVALIACHPVGVDGYAEDLTEQSVDIVLVRLGLDGGSFTRGRC
jgi:hypothetical protein